jgi:hypothetical protein
LFDVDLLQVEALPIIRSCWNRRGNKVIDVVGSGFDHDRLQLTFRS